MTYNPQTNTITDPNSGFAYTPTPAGLQNAGITPPQPTNVGAPVGTGQQPPNPNPIPTSTGGFSSYVKSDISPTVYGKDANGNYTAFSNEADFLASGGNFANVQTIKGFNPGATPIYKQATPTQNPLAPVGIGNVPTTPSGSPDYYKLYQQQLQQFGIGTGNPATDPNQQLLDINKQIAASQQVLAPLTPEMVQAQFPAALQPLQEGGATQAQLNLKAAQAAAPIQSAMSFLIQSRSALGTYLTNAQSFATNAVEQAKTTYQQQLQLQQYDFTQIGSHIDALGNSVPDYGYVNKFTGKTIPATSPNADNLTQPNYVTSGFAQNIATRPSPSNPNVTEYYNTQTGQGFSSPQQLADFYNKQTNSNIANSKNIFGLLNSSPGNPDILSSGNNIPTANSRTDRNNNPIAASISVNPDGTPNMADGYTKEWIMALDKTNIPYAIEQNHNFGNRATIQFPTVQNGIDGAITLLGTSAFNWYKKSSYGGSGALAGINSPSEFTALSYDKKVAAIKQLYAFENGGKGAMFNVANTDGSANTNLSLTGQIASLGPVLSKYVSTSPTGYAYTNPSTPNDGFRNAIAARAKDVIPLSVEQASRENSLVTGFNLLENARNIVNTLNLPTDPYDPERLINGWNNIIQSNPKLAQLNQQWQAAINTLSGLGMTGVRSTLLIDRAALSDFPTATSIADVAQAQMNGLKNILQIEEKTVMGSHPIPIDYQTQSENILQGSVTNGTNPIYDTLNQSWAQIQVGQ